MRNSHRLQVVAAAVGFSAFLVAPAIAQQKEGMAVHKPVQTVAMTFAKAGEAWSSILADRKALDETIQSGKLSEAHEIAFSIRDAVVTLPYKSAALAPDRQKALAAQVRIVAAIAENIDKYADAGNAPKTKAEYAKLVKALDAIEALYPANALPSSGAKPMSAADKALFLTPGGVYTQADIEANGNTSAYQKYASVVPMHDAKVNPGDPVCPISETKPNPQLTWVIGGKKYTFCCPPCIAEFVKKAKTDPKSIKAPESYVKQ
jgi:YHS domain-containing protein